MAYGLDGHRFGGRRMTGLKLDFTPEGINILTSEMVEGVWANIQGALVNVGTGRGSDKTFVDRGTQLFELAVRNGIPSPNEAQHQANFAAVDTLFFQREQERQTDADSPEALRLTPASLGAQRLELDLFYQTTDGRTFGLTETPLTNLTQ